MKIVGNMVGGGAGLGQSFIFVDEKGNEVLGFVVDQETVFTATAADIKKGKTAGTEQGIVTGTHEC